MASQKIFNNPINTQSFETNDYDRFKHLTGNRTLQKESDIHKLMLSLQQHGWIGEHVIVNENDEVIDGQNRIEACRRLNIPFRYTVIPGLTINDCIILNSNKRNWDVMTMSNPSLNKDLTTMYGLKTYMNYTQVSR